MLICVFGLGEIGMSTAKYSRDKGLKVYGYDISEDAAKRANQQGIRTFFEWQMVPEVDVYVICVSTWNASGQPDLSAVFEI